MDLSSHMYSAESLPGTFGLTAAAMMNRAVLVLLIAAGATLGVSPYLIFVEHQSPLYVVTVALLVVSIIILFNRKETSLARPGTTELLLGGVYAASVGATVAIVSIAGYWLGYLLTFVINWGAGVLSVPARIDATSIAFWLSFVLFVLFGLANAVMVARVLSMQLYPRTAGLSSTFYPLARFRPALSWTLILLTVAVALLEIVLLQLAPGVGQKWFFGLVLSYTLVIVGTRLQRLGGLNSADLSPTSPAKAVEKLFEVAGYTVTPSPRTGDEEIDPLLLDAPDLLAATPSQAFAVEVATEMEAEDSLKNKLADLSSAAWALDGFLRKGPGSHAIPIQPLLVYIGNELPMIAKIYEDRGLLRVVQLEDAGLLRRFQKTMDEESRKAFASSLLEPLTSGPTSRVAT